MLPKRTPGRFGSGCFKSPIWVKSGKQMAVFAPRLRSLTNSPSWGETPGCHTAAKRFDWTDQGRDESPQIEFTKLLHRSAVSGVGHVLDCPASATSSELSHSFMPW